MMEPNQNAPPTPEWGEVPATSWFDSLPEDLRSNESVAGWKDKTPADVLKANLDLEGRMKDAIIPLGENATDEDKSAFNAKIRALNGVPDKVEDYKLTLPPEAPVDDPIVQAMIKSGFEQGVNPAQLQSTIQAAVKTIIEMRESQKLVNQEAIKTLWKNEYDTKLTTAITGLEKSGKDAGLQDEEIVSLSKELALNPAMVRIFETVGKQYQEDHFVSGQVPGGVAKMEKTLGGTPMLDFPSMRKQ